MKTEHSEQAALIQWAALMVKTDRYPELSLLFSVPNGASLSSMPQAAKLKAEGLRAGVPDLFLPVVRGDMAGLFVEMKLPGGVVSPAQREFMAAVVRQGYLATVCYSADDAIRTIETYLGG